MAKNSWAYGGAPAQGSAQAPIQSDAQTAAGFKKGIDCACKNDDVQSLPGVGSTQIDIRPGVWHPAAKKP